MRSPIPPIWRRLGRENLAKRFGEALVVSARIVELRRKADHRIGMGWATHHRHIDAIAVEEFVVQGVEFEGRWG